jgi:chaperone BCS1
LGVYYVLTRSAGYTEWQDPISRPSRPWSSVILPLKEPILKDMERFLSDKETRWYAARGKPDAPITCD